MGKFTDYMILLRIPGLGALSIPPVIAALSVQVFDVSSLLILFLIGCLSAVFGFVLNDYSDIEVDKQSKELKNRPLVSGAILPGTALWVCLICILGTLLLFFVLFFNTEITVLRFYSIICLLIAWILGTIYDVYGKKIFASDILVALSVSFIFLIGAFAVNKIPNMYTLIIFILTFNNLFHMNAIEGGIKDADHDVLMDVNNIVLRAGVKVTENKLIIPVNIKILSIGIRLVSICLLFTPFIIFKESYSIIQLVLLACGSVGVLFFSIKLLSLQQFDRNKIRKYISIQSFLRYSLVPLMLFSLIGFYFTVFLIAFPILWYLVFTPFSGNKLLRPQM